MYETSGGECLHCGSLAIYWLNEFEEGGLDSAEYYCRTCGKTYIKYFPQNEEDHGYINILED